ncbi:zinc finger protein 692-like isoform X2 [Pyxicephalus adspersus]|uniref:zinc finger protein 692-like isoform X2 n=1 Tax=Pyxicephalus adspersus TaxID=30357 RepID=UPI003B5CC804
MAAVTPKERHCSEATPRLLRQLVSLQRVKRRGPQAADPTLKRAMQATAQQEKRRLLNTQRGKCRVRLGSHLDEWYALKNHLGFAQHAQFAKFLLDSYISTSSTGTSVPKSITLLSVSISSLKRLAFLCHQHGRDCPTPPIILSPSHSSEPQETPGLLWGCKEHQFNWNPQEGIKGKEANLAIGKNKLNTQESLPDGTDAPEENSESVCTWEMQARESQKEVEGQCGLGICSQGRDAEFNSVVSVSGSVITIDKSEENNIEQVEQSDGEKRLEVVVESTANERCKATISNGAEQKSTVNGQEETESVGAFVCQQEQTKISTPTMEECEKRHSERLRSVIEDTVVSEVTENCSTKLSRMELQETPSGPSRRCQRVGVHHKESHHKTTAEPKAALPVLCRRSPRGTKGSHRKADKNEQVSYSRARCTATCKVPPKRQELTVGGAPETETNEEICPIEESIAEEVVGSNVSAEDSDSLATTEDHQEVEASSDKLLWKADDESPSVKASGKEPPPAESDDQQSSQCKTPKVTRLRPDVDEELDQICKKRIRKATPPELLMCEYENCGKIFSKRQYLNYHQKYQHMNQRTFRCSMPDCGKTFNFNKHLKEHEKRHSDRRDFICEFCARAFRSSSNLIIHRRIHTGEKPLQCEFCGFTCRQKASFNWHMKKHDAPSFYQYPCDICGQRFEKRDNLAAHKSRKHPEPRDGAPQPSFEGDTSSAEYSSQTELAYKEDCQQTLTELTAVSQDSIKGTVFPEYLELTESVTETQVTTQPAGSTELPMVIVL